ncbi:MAG: hypothetical protein QOH76_778 [Thermoleophilaceae bacterium]|jgi:hypothetical protein|nr:hypothetical protein [Thermoleophilaceae bacterium]
MRLSKKVLAGTISAALLLGAPSAYGATSAQQGYSKPGGIVQTQLENGGGSNSPGSVVSTPESVTESKSSGKLPFTGLDLVLVVAAGGLLLGLGLVMRRLSRSTGLA